VNNGDGFASSRSSATIGTVTDRVFVQRVTEVFRSVRSGTSQNAELSEAPELSIG
jgi:hypothetical protein